MPKDYTYARIFNKSHADPQSQMAKISCTLNYFSRQERPDELFLTFTRKVLKNPMNWGNLITNLSNVEIIERENGTEDFRDKIMIDFANKFIGGGALGSGTVQEEIMFHKHVEPLVSMLFTEQLDDNEALIIKGAQRFNETRGFKSDFRFVGDFRELISVDEYKRNDSIISAIDAIYYKGNENIQYDKAQILRELNKAYIGFDADSNEIIKRGVITGRWGCGAFAGNDQLKFIIQWLAASALGKEMYFLPWDMQDLNDLRAFIQIASQYNISKLFAATCRAGRPPNLLNEILQVLTSG